MLLISHVLGDGLITSSRLAELKRDNRLSYRIIAIAVHTGPHAIFAAALLLLVGGPWLLSNVLDQGAHLVSLYGISMVV